MAKGKNMLGKFRGKVGATVFRTEAGIGQIASEFNPNPKNPRTLAQTKQRSKMNLAGLISGLTPYAAIAGLNANGRMARSEFISVMLKAITVTGTGTTDAPFKPTLSNEDVVFSKGAKANVTTSIMKIEDGVLTVSGTLSASGEQIAGHIVVAMINLGGKLNSVIVKSGTGSVINVSESGINASAGDSASIYVIPLFDHNGAASIINSLDVDWATGKYSTTTARTLRAAGAYGGSSFVGLANFTNA